MRGFVNLLLLFLAVAKSNSQLDPNLYFNYYGEPENVLNEDKFYYFDTDILEALSTGEPNANIFISPLSIKTALTMILEGAANESEKEIKRALRLPDDKNLIRKQFQKLLYNFENKKEGVTFKLGNRVFISSKLTPLRSYTQILHDYYYTNVTTVNFMNPTKSADIVNDWVEEETKGFITHIADQGTFSPDTSIFLANALYFKGIWFRSFSEQGTQTSCFYLHDGMCQMSPLMDVVDNFKYGEFDQLDAKIVELDYTGHEFSMIVVLPNKRDHIHQLPRDIRTTINHYAENLTEQEVHVTLPRFSFEYSTDLVKYLPNVNIHTINQPNADLSNITSQLQGRISKMLHKARIEVNEQGTVAAAVTGAVVIPLMGNMKPRFRANHPFLFFIRHIPTKTILFEGRLMKPEKAQQQPQNPIPNKNQPRPQHTNTNKKRPNYPQPLINPQSNFPPQPPSFPQSQQPIFQPQQPNYEHQPIFSPPPQNVQPQHINFDQNKQPSNYHLSPEQQQSNSQIQQQDNLKPYIIRQNQNNGNSPTSNYDQISFPNATAPKLYNN